MTAGRTSRERVAATDIPDAPTDGDRRRIRHARRKARARWREIDAARDAAMEEAFRDEMGLVVRSASPLLMSLLAIEGRTLDDAVEALEPRSGWPSRPRLSGSRTARSVHVHLLRYYMAARCSQFARRPPTPITERPLVSRTFVLAAGGHLELQVVDHSLEVEARLGPAWIETRFGELSIQLDFELPATVAAADFAALGIVLPLRVSLGWPGTLIDANGRDVCVVDHNGELPDTDAIAIATLIGRAVNLTELSA